MFLSGDLPDVQDRSKIVISFPYRVVVAEEAIFIFQRGFNLWLRLWSTIFMTGPQACRKAES